MTQTAVEASGQLCAVMKGPVIEVGCRMAVTDRDAQR